jgi:hypothetical protein
VAIEEINSYHAKVRGEVRNRRLEVIAQPLWRCTQCGWLWEIKTLAKDHICKGKRKWQEAQEQDQDENGPI